MFGPVFGDPKLVRAEENIINGLELSDDKDVSKLTAFVGASVALIVRSGIGVLDGSFISQYVSEKHLHCASHCFIP